MAATPTPSQYQAIYRACIKEAAAQGRALMQRVVERALKAMPQRASVTADVVDRNLLAEAARVLSHHQAALCEAYPQALLTEFAQAIAGDNRKAAGVSFEALELMGEDQVQESVEVVRTQQSVAAAVEAELTELNALICAAQGLKSVHADRNPMRPEVYVRSLRNVTQQSPVSPSVRRRWLMHLGEAMGPELAAAYRELCAMLRAQGVSEAGFAVVQSASPVAAPAPAATGNKALLNVRELRQLLSGRFDGPAAAGAAPGENAPTDFSMTVPAAFETLQEMRQVDQVMQRLRARQGTQPAGGDAHAHARTPAQALGLEVVQLMLENIAGDARLLPPVQHAVRALEPALLRLALGDPRFFSDREHPARRLLDEMTQRSLAWPTVEAPGFAAFIEPLQQAVEALVETRVAGAEPFDYALRSLREAWDQAQQRDTQRREKAVRVLLKAEQRNLLAGKIAKELRLRPDVAAVRKEVQQFLMGPWSQVMAQARLSNAGGGADPGGYAAVVTDLAWSVQPELTAGQAARLTRIIPPLVEKLKRGLASIDFPPSHTQRVLDQFARWHEQALKPAPAQPATRRELEELLGENDDAWLAPTEAKESGFIHTDFSDDAPQPLFQPTQPGFSDTRPRGEVDSQLPEVGLPVGSWVELFADGGWARWQLTWSSPHGTLFMFTHPDGRTQSMTRRLLDKMMGTGMLRLVASQAVVEGALDFVAQTALSNSLDLKLEPGSGNR
jgi:hypothetical protein